MKLILVRHGETLANVRKINQGHGDWKLTKKGREQADKLGKRLAGEKIDIIYCSDLERTKETAKAILKYVKTPIRYVKELRERNMGVFEHRPLGSFVEYVKKHDLDLLNYKPEGGESINAAIKRVMNFYNGCLEKHKGQTVLWVSHGGIIAKLLLRILNLEPARYNEIHPENCALSIIEINDNQQHKVHLLNCTKHL